MSDRPAPLDEETIEKARRSTSLVSMIARRVNLKPAGAGRNGLCPFHDEKTPSFVVYEDRGFYHCYGCGAHGDAIRWVQEVEGVGFRDAVRRLLGGQLPDGRRAMAAPKREAAPQRAHLVSSSHAGRWIYRSSGPARGEIVERWLEARGLDPMWEPLPGLVRWDEASQSSRPALAIDQCRFHPRCPLGVWRVDERPEDAWRTAPAMVWPITDTQGAVRGVHVTYLSGDGRSKAQLPRLGDGSERPTRKIFGKVAGHAIFLIPHEMIGGAEHESLSAETIHSSRPPLIVGEGVETTWSYGQSLGKPCRAAAAVSLGNLQGAAKRIRGGALPLWDIRSDPNAPPFLIERAGEVIILVDADMKPLKRQKVQIDRGERPVEADIDGLQRAEICAQLAVQAWRRAGARPVRAVRPHMGFDFNDAPPHGPSKPNDFNDAARADHPVNGRSAAAARAAA